MRHVHVGDPDTSYMLFVLSYFFEFLLCVPVFLLLVWIHVFFFFVCAGSIFVFFDLFYFIMLVFFCFLLLLVRYIHRYFENCFFVVPGWNSTSPLRKICIYIIIYIQSVFYLCIYVSVFLLVTNMPLYTVYRIPHKM